MNRGEKRILLSSLSGHPLWVVFLVLAAYGAWFMLPVLLGKTPGAEAELVGLDKAQAMFGGELVVAVVLALFVTAIGWWRKTGFTPMEKGSLKFLLIPLVFALFLHQMLTLGAPEEHALFGFTSPGQVLMTVLTVLLLGFNEEMVFRGITFYGFSTVTHPILAVVIAALIFGLFHYVNLFGGQEFVATTYQVLHAMAAGFMYGAMRLITGAIWPVMLFHGFWDLNLWSVQTVNGPGKDAEAAAADLVLNTGMVLTVVLPALLYGIFLCWRWSVRRRAGIPA